MKLKTVKRIILIALLCSMAFAFFGYQYGLFNRFLARYSTETTASAAAPQPDTTASATAVQEDEPGTGEKQVEEIENKKVFEGQSVVSIVQSSKEKAEQISYEEIRSMVDEAVELAGGFEGVIRDNQVVVLKPNLVQMHVDSTGQLFDKELNGVTTDWKVTKAVVELVRQYNPHGKVYVMEGSAGDGTKKTMEYLKYTHENIPGVDEFLAIEEDSGKWQDFNSPGIVKKHLAEGLLHKDYYMNKKYYDCDVLISMPCLKTNSGTVVSGSIKNVSIGATPANIYGVTATNPGRTRMVSHKITDGELDKWLYDYYMCKPVNFVIMDGLQGFQNGPVPIGRSNVTGDRMNMRLIMAGRDSVAVDTVEALIMGWDPQSIAYLKYLSDSGMGSMDTSKITVAGKFADEVRKAFKIRFSKLGGAPIADKTPPALAIKNLEAAGDKLDIELDTAPETVKVEVYVDGKLQLIGRPPECKEITMDVSGLSKGEHEIKIVAYDRFLNRSETRRNIER